MFESFQTAISIDIVFSVTAGILIGAAMIYSSKTD